MGNIPADRLLVHQPAFSAIIIDLCVPFETFLTRNVKASRHILVCSFMTTRAVHLEIVANLTTDATLIALKKFMLSKGTPKVIYSDNGTNFVGAANKIKSVCEQWNKILLKSGILNFPIEWKFSPARASHFNGAVEIMVKLNRKLFYNTLDMTKTKMHQHDDMSLSYLIAECAHILNFRPIEMTKM